MSSRPTSFGAELFDLLQAHISPGQAIYTLSRNHPNWVVAIEQAGLLVETEKTRDSNTGAQLVPAWMFEVAWQRLTARGRISKAELVSSEDLNVKRSSLVCAALATLPGVTVSTNPIVLTYER